MLSLLVSPTMSVYRSGLEFTISLKTAINSDLRTYKYMYVVVIFMQTYHYEFSVICVWVTREHIISYESNY